MDAKIDIIIRNIKLYILSDETIDIEPSILELYKCLDKHFAHMKRYVLKGKIDGINHNKVYSFYGNSSDDIFLEVQRVEKTAWLYKDIYYLLDINIPSNIYLEDFLIEYFKVILNIDIRYVEVEVNNMISYEMEMLPYNLNVK